MGVNFQPLIRCVLHGCSVVETSGCLDNSYCWFWGKNELPKEGFTKSPFSIDRKPYLFICYSQHAAHLMRSMCAVCEVRMCRWMCGGISLPIWFWPAVLLVWLSAIRWLFKLLMALPKIPLMEPSWVPHNLFNLVCFWMNWRSFLLLFFLEDNIYCIYYLKKTKHCKIVHKINISIRLWMT